MRVRRPKTATSCLTLALFLATAGCISSSPSSSPAPKLENYDRSCTPGGTECRPVFVGAGDCCDLECPNGAVNARDLDRAISDSFVAGTCGINQGCAVHPRCSGDTAICVAGQCQIYQHPSTLSLAHYDRSCTSVDDCADVFFDVDPCCKTTCANTAVRADQVDLVDSDVGEIRRNCPSSAECGLPPLPVDAGTRTCTGRLACVAGVCELLGARPDDGGLDASSADGAAEP
jgi:hypothetical protein